jgi:hypothetical protein
MISPLLVIRLSMYMFNDLTVTDITCNFTLRHSVPPSDPNPGYDTTQSGTSHQGVSTTQHPTSNPSS